MQNLRAVLRRKCVVCNKDVVNPGPWAKSGLPTRLLTCDNKSCLEKAAKHLSCCSCFDFKTFLSDLLNESEDILTQDSNALNHHKAFDFLISRIKLRIEQI